MDSILALPFDLQAAIQRARENQAALFRLLPCSTCTVDSAAAMACAQRGRPGCQHEAQLRRRESERERMSQRCQALAAAGVPSPEAFVQQLDHLEPKPALEAVRRVLAEPGIRWLVLTGPAGVGKTLACYFALAARPRGRPGLFVTAGDLGRPRPLSGNGWTVEDARRTPLLVVDDLGLESRGEYAAAQVEEVIGGREHGDLLTITSSNLTHADLRARYGARIWSRFSGARGLLVSCPGEDLRAGPKALRGEP